MTNLRFADNIDALAEEEQKQEALVDSLDKTSTRYKTEISVEKTKLMINSANDIHRESWVLKQASGTLEQLFQMLAANQRFSQGLHKPRQLSQS